MVWSSVSPEESGPTFCWTHLLPVTLSCPIQHDRQYFHLHNPPHPRNLYLVIESHIDGPNRFKRDFVISNTTLTFALWFNREPHIPYLTGSFYLVVKPTSNSTQYVTSLIFFQDSVHPELRRRSRSTT